MIAPRGHSWQLILADLALILFLVTLTALANEEAKVEKADANNKRPLDPAIASAQALYRPTPSGPGLGAWLSEQSPDPRATLTVFAVHSGADRDYVWERALDLAREAQAQQFAVRVVISQGPRSDIYASLAYDEQREVPEE